MRGASPAGVPSNSGLVNYTPDYVILNDDCFTCRKVQELEEFSERYRKEIGLPFRALATPSSITEQKVGCLVRAGLDELEIGVQSASPHTLELYRREWAHPDKVFAAAEIMAKFKANLPPTYDFIVDNPWETDKDVEDSIRLALNL